MNTAPKYSKIELITKNNLNQSTSLIEENLLTFEDCGMFISGDFLIIVEDTKDETGETNTVTEGTVFNLTNIKQYKTYAL
jgi:hypothetical protein